MAKKPPEKITTQTVLISIAALILSGCASGPVTTQIDTKKNPVVEKPAGFQSPAQAISLLLASSPSKASRAPHVQKIKTAALKTLFNQQIAIGKELRESGKLRLQPWHSYEFDIESFCVNAGVERPVRGDGLFLGDMQGKAKTWLPTILQNYIAHGISQQDAQVLIWSLLSETKFDQLSYKNQELLLKLFPDAPVRFGNAFSEDHAKDFLLSKIPPEIIGAKENFDKYRDILQDARSNFYEIERKFSPESSRVKPLDVGWLKHEGGYYIHLRADGYSQVHVQIYAPEGIGANTYFDPTKQVALPGQGQRLALSTTIIDNYKEDANQFIKDKLRISAGEALFILKHPLDTLKIYGAAQKAIQTTWSHLKSSHNYEDDNTDAFRHFVWSGLVTHEIGSEEAREYLTAHEDFPSNDPKAKSMDLYNNEKGIGYSSRYNGDNFENDLVQEGLNKIRDHDLKWLK